MIKLSSGAFDDSSAREEAVTLFVGFVMVFFIVVFVVWFNDVFVCSVFFVFVWV